MQMAVCVNQGWDNRALWRHRMSSLLKCAAMRARAKLLQGAWDKGPEGSRGTSCPCLDETIASVNKPPLAVMAEVGRTIEASSAIKSEEEFNSGNIKVLSTFSAKANVLPVLSSCLTFLV